MRRTYTSGAPDSSDTYARYFPSGDHRGDVVLPDASKARSSRCDARVYIQICSYVADSPAETWKTIRPPSGDQSDARMVRRRNDTSESDLPE